MATRVEVNPQPLTSLRQNKSSEFSRMIKEAKHLGLALSIPCLDGVEEAEAQCALLNLASLCDDCSTSDSDAFLFGARTVYRDVFIGIIEFQYHGKEDLYCIIRSLFITMGSPICELLVMIHGSTSCPHKFLTYCRERDIIRLYHGIGIQCHTWEDISRQFGLSRERVRQVGLIAMEKLKHAARRKKLDALLKDY